MISFSEARPNDPCAITELAGSLSCPCVFMTITPPCTSVRSSRTVNSPYDAEIASATTKVVLQSLLDLIVSGRWVPVQQGFRRHNQTWRTEATRDGARIDEGLLDRMQLPIRGQSLNRLHFCTV